MTHEILTPFEKKILDEVIRPALSNSYESHYYGQATYAQDLNFVKLVRNVRVFYQKNCGQNWNKVCIESEKPEEHEHKGYIYSYEGKDYCKECSLPDSTRHK